MFGRIVKVDDLEIHVSCLPSTPMWKILEKAAEQMKARQSEPDYAARGRSIAFRHNISVVR